MRSQIAMVLTVVLVSLPANIISAAEKPTSLFNGRDLAGWTYHLDKPNVPMEDVWAVKDGVLSCKGEPAGYLLTTKNDFKNYVLTLEWRWPRSVQE